MPIAQRSVIAYCVLPNHLSFRPKHLYAIKLYVIFMINFHFGVFLKPKTPSKYGLALAHSVRSPLQTLYGLLQMPTAYLHSHMNMELSGVFKGDWHWAMAP